jgi:Beta/Gamma crystallin
MQTTGGDGQVLDVGRYNVGQLSFGNDMISSVKVPPGWKVTLYRHADFQGDTRELTADTRALPDFNDETSSIVVEKTGR